MEFRIADTFTDSLAKLTGEEQKAVKTAVRDVSGVEIGSTEGGIHHALRRNGV
jgi:hypothetical protein